jgi:hypothetical protein
MASRAVACGPGILALLHRWCPMAYWNASRHKPSSHSTWSAGSRTDTACPCSHWRSCSSRTWSIMVIAGCPASKAICFRAVRGAKLAKVKAGAA